MYIPARVQRGVCKVVSDTQIKKKEDWHVYSHTCVTHQHRCHTRSRTIIATHLPRPLEKDKPDTAQTRPFAPVSPLRYTPPSLPSPPSQHHLAPRSQNSRNRREWPLRDTLQCPLCDVPPVCVGHMHIHILIYTYVCIYIMVNPIVRHPA